MNQSLQIDVLWQDGQIRQVQTRLQRPMVRIRQLLLSRSPGQALACIPLLFAICAGAQQVAAVMALEQAMAFEAPRAVQQARQWRIRLEQAREALLRLVQDWALPVPEDLLRQQLQQLQQGMALLQPALALGSGHAARLPGPLLRALQVFFRVQAGQAAAQWLEPALARWQDICLSPARTVVLQPDELCQLSGDGALIGGQPRVTGPAAEGLAEVQAVPLLRQRVLALQQLAGRALAGDDEVAGFCPAAGEVGQAWVMTARGLLLHRVRLQAGQLQDWQILAPTDWNFGCGGLLEQQLAGVRVPAGQTADLVRAMVLSMDPCLAFEVNVRHA